MSKPTIDIVVTAPNGCGSAYELLKSLNNQMLSSISVNILESGGYCDKEHLADLNFEVRHTVFDTQLEAQMRVEAFEKSQSDWLMVLEDHVVVAEDFIAEFIKFIEKNPNSSATTFYALNGTDKSLGSRALFSWVWGLAAETLYPAKPEPVCSAFVVKRSGVIDLLAKKGEKLEPGSLETQIVPELIRSSNKPEMTRVVLTHFEGVGLFTGAKAVYSNARIAGHLEKELLTNIGWIKVLILRFGFRPRQIRKAAQKSFVETCCLYFLALAGVSGYFLGGLVSIGKASEQLAHAHPRTEL